LERTFYFDIEQTDPSRRGAAAYLLRVAVAVISSGRGWPGMLRAPVV
jgi:hypothetical protein